MKRRKMLAADLSEMLERQEGCCAECGKELDLIHKLYDIDHKRALANKGKDTPDNSRVLCLDCHRKKTRKEASARAKIKRQGPPTYKKPENKKTSYKCKLSLRARSWNCMKKKASKSCLKRGLFDNRCKHLLVSRK